MYTLFFAEGSPDPSLGWLLWILLAFFFLMVLIGWWVSRRQPAASETHPAAAETHHHQESPSHPDDLTILEGIGPKVASVLNEAGIVSFAQLATANPEQVREVLKKAGLQMLDPQGWIEQARLAAQGDWEGLKRLQSELKGGRHR